VPASSLSSPTPSSPEVPHGPNGRPKLNGCYTGFWNTLDPSIIEGSRENHLDTYRNMRDKLFARIRAQFGPAMMTGL